MQLKRKPFIIFSLISIVLLSQVNLNFISISKIDDLSSEQLNAQTIRIVTRHDVTITSTFRTAFLASQIASDLDITDIQFYQASTDSGWVTLLEDPSRGIDLAWGGDPSLFEKMENLGLLKHIDNETLKDYIDTCVPDTLAGQEMKLLDTSDDLIWVGTALSSYGFTVNHNFLSSHSLPVPSNWENLTLPDYYINPSVKAISMSDAPLSTSNSKIYQIILQAFGWDDGWEILTIMAANAGIYPGSVDTRAAVVNNEVGIGLTIDFYGIIAQRENPLCEYIVPEGQSVILPVPIALGINVDNQEAAEGFIEYILSAEGQSTWLNEGLDRLPINEEAFLTPLGQTRTDLYSLFNETIDNTAIAFNDTLASENLDIVIYYFHQTLVEPHNKLRLTWGELVARFRDSAIGISQFLYYADRLGEVEMTLQQSIDWNEQYRTDSSFASQKDSEWKAYAENKYDTIYNELLGLPAVSEFERMNPIIISFSFIMFVFIYRRRKKCKKLLF